MARKGLIRNAQTFASIALFINAFLAAILSAPAKKLNRTVSDKPQLETIKHGRRKHGRRK
jgi:hypothetical protein